jgi:hypothetical protein
MFMKKCESKVVNARVQSRNRVRDGTIMIHGRRCGVKSKRASRSSDGFGLLKRGSSRQITMQQGRMDGILLESGKARRSHFEVECSLSRFVGLALHHLRNTMF